MRRVLIGALLMSLIHASAAAATPAPGLTTDLASLTGSCAGDPAALASDTADLCYSMGRLEDQTRHPDFQRETWEEIQRYYPGRLEELSEGYRSPQHHIPGAEVGDAYRLDWNWEAKGRGWSEPIEFRNRFGATLAGTLWFPPGPRPEAGGTGPRRPFVIVSPGGNGIEEAFRWAAQGLAEAGYIVMTFDPQGHGSSDACGDGEGCPGESALTYLASELPQTVGMKDGLDWALAGPYSGYIDEQRIGVTGHSLGGWAALLVGHADPRVDVVVSWDSTGILPADMKLRTPTMLINSEMRNVCPLVSVVDCADVVGDAGSGARLPGNEGPDDHIAPETAERLRAAGVPTASLVLRGSTHQEWTYVYALVGSPASSKGERVSMYYTLAWFDRWLKGPGTGAGWGYGTEAADSATRRLTATYFDGSADASSIGTGVWDPGPGNVPYKIEGDAVADHLSRFYRSEYDFGTSRCRDMRAGC